MYVYRGIIVLHAATYVLQNLFCSAPFSSCSVLALHSVPCTKHIKRVWFGAGNGMCWKRCEICVSERENHLQSVRLGRSAC